MLKIFIFVIVKLMIAQKISRILSTCERFSISYKDAVLKIENLSNKPKTLLRISYFNDVLTSAAILQTGESKASKKSKAYLTQRVRPEIHTFNGLGRLTHQN